MRSNRYGARFKGSFEGDITKPDRNKMRVDKSELAN